MSTPVSDTATASTTETTAMKPSDISALAVKKNHQMIFPRWLLVIALALQAAVVGVLLVMSLVITGIFPQGDKFGPGNSPEYVKMYIGTPMLTVVLGCIVFFVVVYAFAYYVSRISKKAMLLFLLAFVLIAQIIWIVALGLTTYLYADSESLMDAASTLLNGETYRFDPTFCTATNHPDGCPRPEVPSPYRYFSFYPFQSGPLLWFLFVGKIFGVNNILAFQLLSAFALTTLVAALWHFGTLLGLDAFGHAAFTAMTATCVPLLMFAAFVYPNAVGFSFTILGVVLVVQAFRVKRVWTSVLAIIGGFIICGVGIIFKSTFIIVVLAACIAAILVALSNRRYWQGLVAILGTGLAVGISKLPTPILEHLTHQKFGKGMPMLSWIMLGLNDSGSTMPGWWTGIALDAFSQTNGDYAAQQQIAKQFVTERLSTLLQHPSEGIKFFGHKLATEWSEPTFMTLYYSQGAPSNHDFSGLPSWITLGTRGRILLKFEDITQSFLYLMAFIGVITIIVTTVRTMKKKLDDSKLFTQTFLSAAFLGGFICYVFWEAKGIYTLPFYLLLLPLGAYGMQMSGHWVHGVWQRRHKKKAVTSTSHTGNA